MSIEESIEQEQSSRVETFLMMELRHASERAELLDRATRDAYVAGLNDRPKSSNSGGAMTLMDQVTERISDEYKFTVKELRGPGRSHCYSEARRVIWSELKRRGYSLPQIGKFFGRDHTSILHGLKAHGAALKANEAQACTT